MKKSINYFIIILTIFTTFAFLGCTFEAFAPPEQIQEGDELGAQYPEEDG
ncbi:MAG: hypothetical protein V3U54_05450 [Thermodesulfobacteriota bacterium]